MNVLTVKELRKKFKRNNVIKGVSFELPEKKIIALLGANGAGKTTTLQIIAGLMNKTGGEIQFEGVEAGTDTRQMIGYLPQFPVFYQWMSGKEFLQYVGKLSGLSNEAAAKKTTELLALVGIADAGKKKIANYSGGMKQRLGIAQALIHDPKLLILDEPVSALDPLGRREVIELLKKLKTQITVLFSTHILSDAEEVSDEILFLHHGEIVESGSLEALTAKYKQPKITLVFERSPQSYIDQLHQALKIDEVDINGKEAVLLVNETDKARDIILQMSVEDRWPLVKFEMSKAKLEEMFLKVVQGQ
ncbi:ABC transporter ATP-binding protein [Cytobacillus horneckiae]|uniref:ABC transporter ATP-binding protein n=1 Tax=Cytobacillus horneckiae TaxID=549687 RepID=A0A2N0ZL49_9BACI|nr:ABC transporter ATP-binding protein [Cytobacillus horneckiae]MEC1156215.1 ABC transporter ATP-binding protein [Cytobacillus horneckiae]MED2938233.1 ABC transporter ATP-binding protein [Cytobacillus horneckiae]PKG30244.1 ABC transporter ATP-binding protein [Cytobacillus horneckiae]